VDIVIDSILIFKIFIQVLHNRWHGAKISFGFLLCPICKTEIKHESLADQLQVVLELKKDVNRKALLR
jgi:RCR-type E3 ubiquitin transferase